MLLANHQKDCVANGDGFLYPEGCCSSSPRTFAKAYMSMLCLIRARLHHLSASKISQESVDPRTRGSFLTRASHRVGRWRSKSVYFSTSSITPKKTLPSHAELVESCSTYTCKPSLLHLNCLLLKHPNLGLLTDNCTCANAATWNLKILKIYPLEHLTSLSTNGLEFLRQLK